MVRRVNELFNGVECAEMIDFLILPIDIQEKTYLKVARLIGRRLEGWGDEYVAGKVGGADLQPAVDRANQS